MKQIIQKKIIRTVTLWMLVLTMGLSMTGCGPKSSFGSQTLDIDYVGSDGEVTEEEVSAKSENPMEWLKKKLTGDKKNAGVNGRENVAGYTEDTTVQDLYGVTSDKNTKTERTSPSEVPEESDDTQQSTIPIPKKDNTDGSVDIPVTDDSTTSGTNSSGKNNTTTPKNTVTFTIRCDTAVANGMAKDPKWAGIVPASGCILPVITMEFEEGETVFDLLCRIRDTYKLQMEYTGSSGGQYIQGINNLYEFDGGRWSGWMYCVNSWYPNYGCGQYKVKAGDVIEWNYTCDLGLDLDGGWWDGAQDWKDTHE